MMHISKCIATATLLLGGNALAASKEGGQYGHLQNKPISIEFKEFEVNSAAGRELLAAAVPRGLQDYSSNFLGNYAIKFQDCHSVTQWNGDNYDDENDRILHKRLVRFRLCPVSSCSSSTSTGCSSKYGDYVVDINTFLYYYLSAQAEANSDIENYCQNECSNASNCLQSCYNENGYSSNYKGYDDDGNSNFDPMNYAQCSEYDNVYIGPYCSDDGKSIFMGIFSDDACSQFSSCDTSCFYSSFGFELPYTSVSLASKQCLSCTDGTFQNEYGNNAARDECQEIYNDAGKCETKMAIEYPNESACTYVNGLKHMKNGGAHNSKKSKEAGLGIGMLSFSSIILVVYVNYLHNKLSVAKHHLNKDTLG